MAGPADQQLRGDNGTDTRFGQQRRPSRVLLDQIEQLWIELVELGREESDPGGNGLQQVERVSGGFPGTAARPAIATAVPFPGAQHAHRARSLSAAKHLRYDLFAASGADPVEAEDEPDLAEEIDVSRA